MKWQRKKVTIARRDGAKVTTAHVYGGLAVHKPLDDNGRQRGKHYVITHAASGLSMCGHRLMDSLDGAKACVERLHSTGINWALSNGELLAAHKATLKTVPDIIDQFRDYALRRAFRL